jgi:precorrin-3B synthase
MAGVITPAFSPSHSSDRCPGVLRPHQAADGAMVRIRIPGGQTTGDTLARLGELARAYGSGLLQLTSRGSVQMRGLPEVPPEPLADGIADAGLLPSPSHDRVRNILASPLTGLHGGQSDLRTMITALDRALQAETELANLSGRFLFALDDGRGDVITSDFDLGYQARGPRGGIIMIGSERVPVGTEDAVPTLIRIARRLVREPRRPVTRRTRGKPEVPLGPIGAHAGAAVPLGLLTPGQVAAVQQISGGGPVVITPWRGLVVPHAADRLTELAAAGLVVEDGSPWTMISACVGAPYCASGRIETLALAARLAQSAVSLPRTHLSGCERRCGAPNHDHLDLVAPTESETFARTGRRADA